MNIEIIKTDSAINLPKYQSSQAAGLDLQAVLSDTLVLKPFETSLVRTGIQLNIKNSDVMAIITPRSGMGHKRGLILGNGVGIIDSDYQGEIFVSLYNRLPTTSIVEPYERIAQLIFVPIIRANLVEVNQFTTNTDRGSSGFGSTGS